MRISAKPRCSTAALALVALGSAGVDHAGAQELAIGYAGGFTGYLAPYDQPSLKGVQLAVDELNAGGGVNGMQVRLVVKDTRSDTAQAAVVAQELVDEGVAAMIVSCDLDPAVASGTVAQAAEVPAANSCASTPTLPAAVGPYMFSNYTADNLENVEVATGSITYKGQGRVPVRVVALNRVAGGEREHVGDYSPDPSMILAP